MEFKVLNKQTNKLLKTMETKYQITPYISDVARKMMVGWTLKYDTDGRPSPSAYLVQDGATESVSNWSLSVLWDNGFLKSDKGYPVSSYKLSPLGRSYFKKCQHP